MKKSIKAILFDHDDTLVATKEVKFAHHKYVAKKFYGKELSDAELRLHLGKPLTQLVCLLYGTDNGEQALANNTSCRDDFPKVLFNGTIPTLEHLHTKGMLLGIVTATTKDSFEHDLELLKIPSEFLDYTQTLEATEYHKPDPRVFEPALQWLAKRHIKPNEVLYVADGLHDMKAALGAGFQFIGVETGFTTHEQFLDHKVTSIPTIAELLNIDIIPV